MAARTAIAIVLMCGTGLAVSAQDSVVSRKIDRIDRLRAWLDAVERHDPGALDDPLMRVASWDRTTLWNVWMDVGAIVSLVREPDIGVFHTPIESEPLSDIFHFPAETRRRLRTRVIPYGRNELNQLRLIAKGIDRGGEDRILKRGAVLHSDIVMAELDSTVIPRQRSTSSILLQSTDGQQTGIDTPVPHWEMGRRLLDKVRPKGTRKLGADPGADETVRLWYLASNIYMQAIEQLDPWHVDRAVELFPQDPEVLFVAACAREMFSGPQIQNVLLSTTLDRKLFSLIADEGEELRRAERLFRASLEQDAVRAEARIRLGRVLGQRGRHQDAIAELRQAAMATKNRLLLYYANLFLGAEADALGLFEESRRAYQSATGLYPLAQSPRLGISALDARAGDRSGALAAIESVLSGDEPQNADDPWWSYYTSQTRDLEGVVAALHLAVKREQK